MLATFLVLAVTAVAYLPSLDNGFTNWDDPLYVTANEAVRRLSPHSAAGFFTSFTAGNYHPLTLLSLAVNQRLFGGAAASFHTVNLALHLANTLLVFLIATLLSRPVAGSSSPGSRTVAPFVAALLFGVHPLHVESVAWIAERKDVLSTFFFLAAWLSYLRHHPLKLGWSWYWLSVVLLALSLLSKSMGVSFPLVIFLSDRLFRRSVDRRMLLEKVPFLALSLGFGAVALIAQRSGEAIRLSADFPLWKTPFIAGYGLVFYLVKLVVPLGLSAFYPLPGTPGAALPPVLPAALLLALALAAAVLSLGRHRERLRFGVLFFLVSILPVLQIVPIGQAVTADRYTYLPSFGLFWLAGEGFARLLQRLSGPRRGGWTRAAAAWAGLALAVVCLAQLTWRRTQVWRDGVTLWENVITSYPDSALARKNLGIARHERSDAAGAVEDLTVALRQTPFDPDVYRSRGSAYVDLGQSDLALADFDRAVGLKPDHAEALNNRGALLAARGALLRALSDFDRAIAVNPRYAMALLNRARAREALGDLAGAGEDRARVRSLER